MKKIIFSLSIMLFLYFLTFLIFYLPETVIYKVKSTESTLYYWANIWVFTLIILMVSCTLRVYYKIGERLFDYLKKD